jgi:hypothetical protein
MTPERLNRRIFAELNLLAAQRVLTAEQLEKISTRYPTGRWDVRALVRWFTLLGAVAMAAGVLLIAPRFLDVKNLLDGGLSSATALLIWLGYRLRDRVPRTAYILHLCSGFSLQGFCVAFAIHHSRGSDNWPALIGICAALVMILAYVLQNRLVLVQACINLFVFFGGETGYMSGWGAYWMSMNYPLRFALAGLASLGIAGAHARYLHGPWQGFSRVWAHFGLLVFNLSLWFFSLFGWFEKEVRWEGTTGQRLGFSLLWGLCSLAAIFGGARYGLRILRSYGLTFLIIDVYTFYFQFVVVKSPEAWFLHLLLGGGSMVALGLWLDARRKQARATPTPAA